MDRIGKNRTSAVRDAATRANVEASSEAAPIGADGCRPKGVDVRIAIFTPTSVSRFRSRCSRRKPPREWSRCTAPWNNCPRIGPTRLHLVHLWRRRRQHARSHARTSRASATAFTSRPPPTSPASIPPSTNFAAGCGKRRSSECRTSWPCAVIRRSSSSNHRYRGRPGERQRAGRLDPPRVSAFRHRRRRLSRNAPGGPRSRGRSPASAPRLKPAPTRSSRSSSSTTTTSCASATAASPWA